MSGIRNVAILLGVCLWLGPPSAAADMDSWMSKGELPDPTTQTLADIRAAEKRQIPLDVALKGAEHFPSGHPVVMTILVTNLFDSPLIMNSRMLVNHPLLSGEVSFRIIGPDGRKVEIQRLITPLSLRDDDFVLLARGQSIQRSVDLSDLYGISQKGVYKIQVSYHNDIDHPVDGRRAWKGEIWSDPIEIRLD
jgi:hypothetical protein